MQTEASKTLTVTNNWLDTSAGSYSVSDLGNSSLTLTNGWHYGNTWYPYIQPYTYSIYAHPKIRLKLSEVEHLRKLAAKDKALKATLQKFTPYIEIEVDF